MERKSKPTWWLVFALTPLMIVLLVIESQTPGSIIEHRILEIGIVLLTFGLMGLWVHANQAALINEDLEKEQWVIEPDPKLGSNMDPHDLPLVDDSSDLDNPPYRMEVYPSKGSYN
ncbi:hypothetical protein ANRL1_02354 [Anaerolineae bacterium]|nr:hypothetical protein ANRL1_02354 [Anaerolineae bacterium]